MGWMIKKEKERAHQQYAASIWPAAFVLYRSRILPFKARWCAFWIEEL